MAETYTDCRSEEGITVGLIDAMIVTARILARRDFTSPAVIEALKDFVSDLDVQKIISEASRI
jgi:hypothetical protein